MPIKYWFGTWVNILWRKYLRSNEFATWLNILRRKYLISNYFAIWVNVLKRKCIKSNDIATWVNILRRKYLKSNDIATWVNILRRKYLKTSKVMALPCRLISLEESRVGHCVLLHSERIILLRSFKARNILLHSFFEFLATYETQKNDAFFCVLFLRT